MLSIGRSWNVFRLNAASVAGRNIWGTGFMLGSNRFGPFGRGAPAAFGHLGLVNVAIWADPARGLSAGLISSGKPGSDPEAKRYSALMDRIALEFPATR